MRRWLSCFKPLLLGLAMLAAGSARAGDDSHVLIVAHPSLAVANLTADDLSRIYLLRQSLWPDGVPVDLIISTERPVKTALLTCKLNAHCCA